MTISLKRGNGNDVINVAPGLHTFVIRDRSSAHNFVLLRGTTELRRTGVEFTGKRTWSVRDPPRSALQVPLQHPPPRHAR